MDLGLEAAFEVLACPDSLAMDRIAAREAVISHFQAQQMLDMREVSLDQPPEEYRGNTFYPGRGRDRLGAVLDHRGHAGQDRTRAGAAAGPAGGVRGPPIAAGST